jgi:hypothetical protein
MSERPYARFSVKPSFIKLDVLRELDVYFASVAVDIIEYLTKMKLSEDPVWDNWEKFTIVNLRQFWEERNDPQIKEKEEIFERMIHEGVLEQVDLGMGDARYLITKTFIIQISKAIDKTKIDNFGDCVFFYSASQANSVGEGNRRFGFRGVLLADGTIHEFTLAKKTTDDDCKPEGNYNDFQRLGRGGYAFFDQ